jgi:hypothetical protein
MCFYVAVSCSTLVTYAYKLNNSIPGAPNVEKLLLSDWDFSDVEKQGDGWVSHGI